MKRIIAILLTLALTATLAGCNTHAAPAETTPSTAAPAAVTEGPALVTNVDDFLAAIAPGAEILLAEGDFQLDSASNYGQKTDSPYYTWKDLGLGDYELQINAVDGLTIRGCGSGKTNIVTSPRSASVINILDCQNITLEDMTIGHTYQAEACQGGVVRLSNAKNTTLKGLGLYGCGTVGVDAYQCQDLTMQDCTVYECSISGVTLSQTDDVTINSCAFHSLGKEQPVANVFSVSGGSNITVSNCMISNNYTYYLAVCDSNGTVTFQDNQFVSNKIAGPAFAFWTENIVLADNVFENTEPRNWYEAGSLPAVDLEGNKVIFEAPKTAEPVTPGVANPVSTGDQTEIRVATVDEFLKAIAPDTCIILEAELLDFSKATGYGKTGGEYYTWQDEFDGPCLVIQGVSNLTIKAEGDDRKAHTLSAVPRYADVLTFENCSAITLSGFTAGHTIEPGSCTGGVFLFRSCEDILVDNCGMFGCGTDGVNGQYSKNIQVVNSEIYECSVCAIELTGCENVAISGTLIRDIGDEYGSSNFFRFYDNANVTLDGKELDGNYHGN